ncbi:hypothetical protein COCC4DRAFT_137367 [Bipolaris maydis ATCC 48331]|uniref:Domain of unknown function at the cortex 1 domain-containing protein n=2 Tax=Cochliobolus heterostrophus TaxID=5016 RepID=M2STD5_COCH5|nr:uncharacterized protein COCC4DRAFT_137367 [Bipolaris maydis ATCC 48331]EMD88625.1 hypothetical protein COCHEDRAFT_1109808 [Bipolaris maydis C5]KAH7556707.1 hypothetical protein BM1_06141 [Bipolaris maydis]ENI05659.1 hypothetical protein COCC4DRAFT_137367 [Bipolaris maydis ATCC 48331]KAJ5028776.1 hypothetical protein J3E73DRAFT_407772 [Bipolaris maydis]KAJ5063565.1 hypothetical protein J3E74DRAFT_446187 [Bipolaris maydis]
MSDKVVDPAARDKYLLQVTAGPSYNPSEHEQVAVNSADPTYVESDLLSAWIRVRIKDYHGLPRGSPASPSYFDHPQHTSDRYSIAYSFIPKQDMPGSDLVMGFDYGHSIRHQLPPGFRYAMKIATSLLDPGLYSDPYSDQPYLYGPALSSFFAFQIGENTSVMSPSDQLSRLEQNSDNVIEEGAYGSGAEIRKTLNMPSKWKKRRKFFLDAKALADFTFEKDRMYHVDFFNPHLDFANFALRLPGFSISVARYIDEKTHHLRYVLRNRKTEEVLLVVIFRLLYGKELQATLEQEKNNGNMSAAPETVTSQSGENSTDHDGQTKVTPVEEAERTTSQSPPATTEHNVTKPEPSGPMATESSATNSEYDNRNGQGYTDQASTAMSSLTSSVVAVYSALGFKYSSSSTSDSEASNRSRSPQPSDQSMEAKIDDMDNETVEKFLRDQTSNV